MNFPRTKWILAPQPDQHLVTQFANALRFPKELAALLLQRNIKTPEQVKAFFNPDLNNLHDPFLMRDMDLSLIHI